jgi:hypothetical protein
MLHLGVAGSLELAPSTINRPSMTLEIDSTAPRGRFAIRETTNSLVVRLSSNLLEVRLALLLRYVRDGIGEVNHVDLEGERTTGVPTTLTLMVPRARPPMSPAEVARLMDV